MSTNNTKGNVTDDLYRVEQARSQLDATLIQQMADNGSGWFRLAIKLDDGRVAKVQVESNVEL